MASYPAINDKEYDLLKRICSNTADLDATTSSDVSSITGTANQIVASQATGAVTLSLASDAYFTNSLLIGLGSAGTAVAGVGLEVTTTSTSSPRGIMTSQYSTSTDGARFHMRKARGTRAAPTTVVTGDNLGRVVGTGYDGSNYLEMASIIFGTEGTIAATRVPTNIQFWTGTNAAPSVLTLAATIDSSQRANFVGQVTAAAGGFRAGGAYDTNAANQGVFDYSSGARVLALGADASTLGAINLVSKKSDGSGTVTPFSFSTAGAIGVTAGGTNQSITLTPSGTGITVFTGASQTSAIGSLIGAPLYGAVYLAAAGAPAGGNFVLASNNLNDTVLNAPTGGPIKFSLGNTEKARIAATTGNLLLGGLTTDGTGVLQFPAATTSAGGITMGADTNLYRSAAQQLTLNAASGTNTALNLAVAGVVQGNYYVDSGQMILGTAVALPVIIRTNAIAALTLDSSQRCIHAAGVVESTTTLTGAGAVSVGVTVTKVTTNGVGNALTLADGINGQIVRVVLDVLGAGGQTAILTPTTKTGFTTATFSAAGQTATFQFVTTRGWVCLSSFGATVA